MISDFDEWTANFTESGPLSQLSDAAVGIDAAHFLDSIPKLRVAGVDRKIKEELTVALGGHPLGYRAVIQQVISIWRKHLIEPVFVFSGLHVGQQETSFARHEKGEKIHADAWRFYDGAMVDECLQAFGSSVSYTAEEMFRFLQQILREEGVRFMVAPYSAWAQLAYLQQVGAVDTVAGASELFLYDIPDLITNWDFVSDEFSWVRKKACIQDLGNINPEMFVEACLLAGCSLLPTIPNLDNPTPRSPLRIRGAADMVLINGKGGYAACLRQQEDPQFRALNYLDRFMRVRMAIRHHVVMKEEGKVEPIRKEEATGDLHELLGRRLPEELYFYLSKGLVTPRILDWRASGEHLETPPLDNGQSEEYRKLVRDQLTEVRSTTISLLSGSLHNFYANTDVALRCWFDKENTKQLNWRERPDPKPVVNSWNVPATTFGPIRKTLADSSHLGFAILSLRDSNFASKTIRSKDVNQPLKTHEELLVNSIWRLLQLRDYVDKDHKLTAWGEVLAVTVQASTENLSTDGQSQASRTELEEAAFIAVELMRLDLLNADYMFTSYSGLGFAKNESDRMNVLLVSRVASIAKLRHKQIGFSGALSRHLLGYHGIVSAVRKSLRDLGEVCLVTLLLNGDAVRERDDWVDLGIDLPFLLDHGCAMGLAMNIYLNRVLEAEEPKTKAAHDEAIHHSQTVVFNHSQDFAGDIQRALGLWDAVYKGIKTAGSKTKFGKLFDEVNTWLGDLR